MSSLRNAGLLVLRILLVLGAVGRSAQAGESGFLLTGATLQAEVYVDGDRVGTTPLRGAVPCAVGEHTIRVVRPGFAPYIDVFKVTPGKVTRIEVELVPVAGVLRLAAVADRAAAGTAGLDKVRVFIDGRFAGEAPLETELKIGPHDVRLTRFGYREASFTVTAVAGEVIARTVQMSELPAGENPYKPVTPPPRWYERWWIWATGAAGVTVLAVAIVVPVVYAARGPCDRLGADACVMVPAAPALQIPLTR
jgi:hypothetical protein